MIMLCVFMFILFFEPRKLGIFWNFFSITNLTKISILLENFAIFSILQNWEGEKKNLFVNVFTNLSLGTNYS
jgi:hypothetical protein